MKRTLPAALLLLFPLAAMRATDAPPAGAMIGYTEMRTDLPGGRHANVRTMRAVVVNADGTGRREVAVELAGDADTSTQFSGWSPDGKVAVIQRGWKSPENAQWEEENKRFRFTKEGCLLDSYFVDLATGKAENATAVDRVSFYNSGVFFWPNDPTKLGFTALVDGNSHPFRMDRDGRNKTDLTSGSKEFTYGFSSSRDGKRIAYHKNYQVFLADADGGNAVQVQTGQPFNFGPVWSPDGQWVLFVSGEHYNCHPHIVRADGTGLKKLADRGGYRGVIEFLDVPDFHGGSSDTPVWAADGSRVFYTAKVGENVELFVASLDGAIEQLTHSAGTARHYHPQPSPDGAWLAYGSQREGVRQLYVMRLADRVEKRITNLTAGHAAMWPHWQPFARPWQQVITGAGAGGYAAFPDICRAPNGDLLCVFYSGYGHVSTPNAAWPKGGRIMAVRSRDNGGSWSAPFVVADTDHDDRDPHIAALSDGTVVCNWFAAANPQKPLPDGKPLALFLARSKDNGATWSEPATITVPSPEPFACSAPIRELPDKTLILGLYAENPQTNHAFGATIRSRDAGATWSDLATIGEKSGQYLDAETDVIALKDGSLLAALRSSKTDLYFARSTDMGRTWSDVKSAGFPGHCPHFLRHSSGTILLAHRLPATSMHWSNDDGNSWQGPVQLDTVIGAYPSSVELPGADVLCVYYEEGEGSGIRSVRLRVADGRVTRVDGTW